MKSCLALCLLLGACSSTKIAVVDLGNTAQQDLAPDYCVPAEANLQNVTTTPAAPYFIHQPDQASARTPTILFLPGGGGDHDTSSFVFDHWLSGGTTLGQFRVIVPYSLTGDFPSEADRSFAVLAEVLSCYGGDAAKVHLAGTSNGGVAAYNLMLANPAQFVTLLGAPGLFQPSPDDSTLTASLTGKATFNGAGSQDNVWEPQAKALNQRLTALGLDTRFVEFANEGHILDAAFDENVFFTFWGQH